MQDTCTIRVIARIQSDFPTKFGIPRQSGMVPELISRLIFEPAYRDENALRGLEGYSHLWLIWGFSQMDRAEWSPMVKPPRLGGNKRMGVFATRSPNRPNPIALSSVRLVGMEKCQGKGTVLLLSGADLMDGTPVFDIKPYLSFTDSHPDARNGFAQKELDYRLEVRFPDSLLEQIPADKRAALTQALSLDPRPAYQQDPTMPYGFVFAGFEVRFKVNHGVLEVFQLIPLDREDKETPLHHIK